MGRLSHFEFRHALVIFCLVTIPCAAQDHDVLCRDGSGSSHAEFPTGIAVQVRAARTGELATRTCEALLTWDKNNLTVATGVSQIDLDTFGPDLGLGVPTATFQVKKSADECCMEYRLYSLTKPPRLLRTISGGHSFSAADADLDGRIEIWTADAAAFEDFENLGPADFESAPTVVLRFVHGDLLDVSPQFQSYFDQKIAKLRKELDPDDLRRFKSSDGKLSSSSAFVADQLHRLRIAKAKILEIIWSYLYSGREQKAWSTLGEMWPEADAARIHEAILNARGRGITTRVTGRSDAGSKDRPRHVTVFDAIDKSSSEKVEVISPVPIMLRRPPIPRTETSRPAQSELLLELVIDSAGKVRSAEPAGKGQQMDAALIEAAKDWKFIPAFKGGRAVASRMRLAVSLPQ